MGVKLTNFRATTSRVKLALEVEGGPEKDRICCLEGRAQYLGTFTADTASELDVLGHDGDTLGVDGAQVGVLEQTDQVGLAGFLQSHDGRALEAQIGLEVLSDLTDQTLEGQLADQQLSALLVTADFTQSHGSGPVSVRFLHASSGRGALASSLGGQLFSGGLASGRLTGGLLGTCHDYTVSSELGKSMPPRPLGLFLYLSLGPMVEARLQPIIIQILHSLSQPESS